MKKRKINAMDLLEDVGKITCCRPRAAEEYEPKTAREIILDLFRDLDAERREAWAKVRTMKEELDREKKVARIFERMAMRLEDERRAAKDEIAGLEDKLAEISHENEELREALRLSDEALADCETDYQKAKDIFEGLRWRIYTLLRSADQDGETLQLPRMTMAAEKSETEDES